MEILVITLLAGVSIMTMSFLGGTVDAGTTIKDSDLYINETTTLIDGTWVVNGSIVISNCTLTLDNATVVLNSTSIGSNRIHVNGTSRLVSRDSRISGNALGVCLEVLGDTLLENTTITNMDRDYRGCGVYHESGDLWVSNCTFDYGLVMIWSQSNLTVRDSSFTNFKNTAVDWRYRVDTFVKVVSIENSEFQNRWPGSFGGAISIRGSSFETMVRATILNNTFKDVFWCIYGGYFLTSGQYRNGTLLIENNSAYGCTRSLGLEGSSAITVRRNYWEMRYSIYSRGHQIFIWGDGSPSLSDETIRGGRRGLHIGGRGNLAVRNLTITDVDVGIGIQADSLVIRDSRIEAKIHDFHIFYSAKVHIYDCQHSYNSWVFGTGEILELREINITLVTWQENTPIRDGTSVFETEAGFQVAEIKNKDSWPTMFPLWVLREELDLHIDLVRGTYRQEDTLFYSDFFSVKTVESMVLIINDHLAPEVVVESPTDDTMVTKNSLLVKGTLIERGAGMGTVWVQCAGSDPKEARLFKDGRLARGTNTDIH